jgi:tetratricopeptide (TPR) repeat protein
LPTTTARSRSIASYDAAYIGRGNLYRKAGRIQDAFNDFQKAIQLDTTDPRAYHNRGLIYQSQGQHAFAIEDFSTAISLSTGFAAEPYNGRGLSYLATNDEDNAFADFNTAIKLNRPHLPKAGRTRRWSTKSAATRPRRRSPTSSSG